MTLPTSTEKYAKVLQLLRYTHVLYGIQAQKQDIGKLTLCSLLYGIHDLRLFDRAARFGLDAYMVTIDGKNVGTRLVCIRNFHYPSNVPIVLQYPRKPSLRMLTMAIVLLPYALLKRVLVEEEEAFRAWLGKRQKERSSRTWHFGA